MMFTNMRRVLFVLLFAAIAGTGSLAWAAHGGGGHGGGGHGWTGGGGGHGWSGGGGHGWGGGQGWNGGHVSMGHWGGNGGYNWWGGKGGRYYSGYRYAGWPYRSYRNYSYWPYAYSFFGFPYWYGSYGYPSSYYYSYPSYYYSYPNDYYAYGDDDYVGTPQYYNYPPPQQYVVSRPIGDVARMEVRLPDPDGTLWVQGQQMRSTGSVRHFRSPPLDPSQQYTYNVKAEWNDNGKLVTDERQVKVQANGLAVVDFTRPAGISADVRADTLPPLPPPARQTTD